MVVREGFCSVGFFFSIDQLCDPWAVYFHSTDGTEFLTAKTGNAVFSIDLWDTVFHGNDFSGAYFSAFFAADTKLFIGART